MLSRQRDIEEVMDMEVLVDLHRLRDLARLGLPKDVRGRVYRYLLGVRTADKSEEVTNQRAHEESFRALVPPGIVKLSPVAASVVAARGSGTGEPSPKLISVLAAVTEISRHACPVIQRSILEMVVPLEGAIEEACDMYFAVCAFVAIGTYHTPERLTSAVGQFTTLLRETQPELWMFFHEVSVPLLVWVPGWLSSLLAGRLHDVDVLRLWDVYIADFLTDKLNLHLFVCLAILDLQRERVTSFTTAEEVLSLFCLKLPRLCIDEVVTHARNIREEVRARDLIPLM
eukprot:PhF_6_TR31108/c0_g1_i2/m.45514